MTLWSVNFGKGNVYCGYSFLDMNDIQRERFNITSGFYETIYVNRYVLLCDLCDE